MKRFLIVMTMIAGTLVAQGPRGGGFGGPMGGPGGQGPGPGPAGGAGGRLDAATFDALKTYLTLTDTQVTSLKAALKARAEANQPIFDQIQAKQKLIAEEMAKDAPSATVVGNLMVEVKKLRESIKTKDTGASTDALAILTPAQQTKLKELEAAQKLIPSVNQAQLLGLLARPEPVGGVNGMAMGRNRIMMMRAAGARRAMRGQI